MLELFAIETGTNILLGIVRRLYAAMNRLGGQSDDIGIATQETTNSERREGTQ